MINNYYLKIPNESVKQVKSYLKSKCDVYVCIFESFKGVKYFSHRSVKYAQANNNRAAARHFGIDKRNFRRWRKKIAIKNMLKLAKVLIFKIFNIIVSKMKSKKIRLAGHTLIGSRISYIVHFFPHKPRPVPEVLRY